MPPLSVSSAGQRNKSPFEGRLRFAFQGFYFRATSKAATEYTAVWSLEKRSLLDENRSPLIPKLSQSTIPKRFQKQTSICFVKIAKKKRKQIKTSNKAIPILT